MIDALHSAFGVGVEAQHLTITQVVLRAVLVFFAALCIVRVANKRFFAKKTAFDLILGLILASMLARAINGSEQLGPTIAAGFVLALLHRFLGWLACKWLALAGVIKGHSETLITDGEIDRDTLRKHHIGEDDLLEELRLNGIEKPAQARLARLERSGEISVIPKAS
jgi:uncharacterized membrane protein YcaP (DUF421 family)